MSLERQLAGAFLKDHPSDGARALERLPVDHRTAVVRTVSADAAPALDQMLIAATAECLAGLAADEAAPIVDRLGMETVISVLRRLPAETAVRLLAGLPPAKREALARVLRVPEGTAAALVDPMVLTLPDDISVAEARLRLRRATAGLLHYLYVVDREHRLVGVLDISELLRARSRDPIHSVMREQPAYVPEWMPAHAVRAHPAWRLFHAMPVTDDAGRLIGAIRYQTLRRLEQEAEGGETAQGTAATVAALGELFHLSVAGFVEGISTAAAPRRRWTKPATVDERGGR